MSNNNGRARDGSGPGSTGLQGLAGLLVDVARAAHGRRAGAGVGCESPGVALRAYDRPGAGAGAFGADVARAREMATARLSAASDDAADLAEGFGLDVRLELAKGGREGRIKRLARVAFRCADQCRRLRELADAIQEADADPGDRCPRCGGELRPVAWLADVVGCGACRETWHRPGGGQ